MRCIEDLRVGEVVEFIVDGKLLFDTVTYIDVETIEGRLYDLSCVEIKRLTSQTAK